MLKQGRSTGRIARVMGLTRNVVLGRISRDGELHAFNAKVIYRAPLIGPPPRRAQHIEPFDAAPERGAQLPMHDGVPLLDLGAGCLWPVAEDASVVGRRRFCGSAKRAGSSYCEQHWQMSLGRLER